MNVESFSLGVFLVLYVEERRGEIFFLFLLAMAFYLSDFIGPFAGLTIFLVHCWADEEKEKVTK
jgi:hypothetical protein